MKKKKVLFRCRTTGQTCQILLLFNIDEVFLRQARCGSDPFGHDVIVVSDSQFTVVKEHEIYYLRAAPALSLSVQPAH